MFNYIYIVVYKEFAHYGETNRETKETKLYFSLPTEPKAQGFQAKFFDLCIRTSSDSGHDYALDDCCKQSHQNLSESESKTA